MFQWGKQRIELHERQRSDITSSTDTEVDDDDQSCDTEQANGDISKLFSLFPVYWLVVTAATYR